MIILSLIGRVLKANVGMNEHLDRYHSLGGRKFEHAFKHGSRNGLFVVSLGWFVDSVRRNGKKKLCVLTGYDIFRLSFVLMYHGYVRDEGGILGAYNHRHKY